MAGNVSAEHDDEYWRRQAAWLGPDALQGRARPSWWREDGNHDFSACERGPETLRPLEGSIDLLDGTREQAVISAVETAIAVERDRQEVLRLDAQASAFGRGLVAGAALAMIVSPALAVFAIAWLL